MNQNLQVYRQFCMMAVIPMLGAATCWGQITGDWGEMRNAGYRDDTAIKSVHTTQTVSIEHTDHSPQLKPSGLPSVQINGTTVQPRVVGRSEQNTNLENQVELIADIEQRRYKETVEDLRDLDAILAQSGDRMVDVSQSKVRLADDGIAISWHPDSDIAVVDEINLPDKDSALPHPRYEVFPLYTGIVPERIWNDASQHAIEETKLNGQEVLKITVGLPTRFAVWVDPKQSYRYSRLEQYWANGAPLLIAEASDYQIVDGVPFPIQHTLQKFDRQGNLTSTETRITQEVAINKPLTEDDFSINLPGGTRLTDLVAGVTTTEPGTMQITLENARHLQVVVVTEQESRRFTSGPIDEESIAVLSADTAVSSDAETAVPSTPQSSTDPRQQDAPVPLEGSSCDSSKAASSGGQIGALWWYALVAIVLVSVCLIRVRTSRRKPSSGG